MFANKFFLKAVILDQRSNTIRHTIRHVATRGLDIVDVNHVNYDFSNLQRMSHPLCPDLDYFLSKNRRRSTMTTPGHDDEHLWLNNLEYKCWKLWFPKEYGRLCPAHSVHMKRRVCAQGGQDSSPSSLRNHNSRHNVCYIHYIQASTIFSSPVMSAIKSGEVYGTTGLFG